MSKQMFVYIMTNKGNAVLYTGVTSNLKRRVYEHKEKIKGKFTSRYNINKLVYYEMFRLVQNNSIGHGMSTFFCSPKRKWTERKGREVATHGRVGKLAVVG